MTSTDRLALSVRSLSTKGLSAKKIAKLLRVSERKVFQLRAVALSLSSMREDPSPMTGTA
ncbi:MAG: hypothetical protein ABF968_08975 [Acetobacter sp.]|uniref:hypothetical protein n=1 Tax=Acetobacter sp. TaxID=440 RepID=UPI0039EB4ED7